MKDIEFYKLVATTNPKYVKNQNAGGRKITTIDPQSQTMAATEQWGLYGKMWGVKDISFSTRKYDTTEIMTLSGTFWYPDGEFPYAVSEKSFYVSRNGANIIDTDVEKKLLTSFKSKCLSLIGFNSDVFMGMFEDAAYVDDAWHVTNCISPEQRSELTKLIQETNTEMPKFNQAFGITTLSDMSKTSFEKAKALLLKKLDSENKSN